MIMINRNYSSEIAAVIAESDTEEEKLCIDKRGQFFVCNAGGKILYEIERDAALDVAEWWDADPELIVRYFVIEGA